MTYLHKQRRRKLPASTFPSTQAMLQNGHPHDPLQRTPTPTTLPLRILPPLIPYLHVLFSHPRQHQHPADSRIPPPPPLRSSLLLPHPRSPPYAPLALPTPLDTNIPPRLPRPAPAFVSLQRRRERQYRATPLPPFLAGIQLYRGHGADTPRHHVLRQLLSLSRSHQQPFRALVSRIFGVGSMSGRTIQEPVSQSQSVPSVLSLESVFLRIQLLRQSHHRVRDGNGY
jgi:hypothetical protein